MTATTIDFTMMYATHNAFRRDLDRLTAAAAAAAAQAAEAAQAAADADATAADGGPRLRSAWENFRRQLHIHHTVEDADLWPRLHRAVTAPGELQLLRAMEAEHALIDPLLDAVDAALADRGNGLADRLRELATTLVQHLDHEEADALPLIGSTLTSADWQAFANGMRRRQGVSGAAVYVPWVLDGAPAAEQRRFLKALPAPVRLLNRLLWQPRYRRRQPPRPALDPTPTPTPTPAPTTFSAS